jgi:hypothetical protein
MESVKPSRRTHEHAAIPAQRGEHSASLTQARVDTLFRALVARREYERGVARLAAEPVAPLQRDASE